MANAANVLRENLKLEQENTSARPVVRAMRGNNGLGVVAAQMAIATHAMTANTRTRMALKLAVCAAVAQQENIWMGALVVNQAPAHHAVVAHPGSIVWDALVVNQAPAYHAVAAHPGSIVWDAPAASLAPATRVMAAQAGCIVRGVECKRRGPVKIALLDHTKTTQDQEVAARVSIVQQESTARNVPTASRGAVPLALMGHTRLAQD